MFYKFYYRFTQRHLGKGIKEMFREASWNYVSVVANSLLLFVIYRNFREIGSFDLSEMSKVYEVKESKKLRFKDIIGIDEYKSELQEIVDYFKNEKMYSDLGADFPKGILMYGKPGTGKTMLANALSNEIKVKFFYKSGSEFQGKYVGSGSNRVKKLFQLARKNSPSVIFIDEIDSIGTHRSEEGNLDDALNQLLTEMDGFTKNDHIIVIGATNKIESLDSALLRPGRFDKILEIPIPNKNSRKQILDFYLKKIKISSFEFDFNSILDRTEGFTGADIKNLLNIAALNAINKKRDKVQQKDIEYALDRVLLGNLKNLEEETSLKLKMAYNQTGRTVIAYLLKEHHQIENLTLKTKTTNSNLENNSIEDIPVFTKKDLWNKIQIFSGCRAAEDIVYGNEDFSINCKNYLKKANHLATNYLRDFPTNFSNSKISQSDVSDKSDELKSHYDYILSKLLNQAYLSAKTLLLKNKSMLDDLTLLLIQKNYLDKKEILEILDKYDKKNINTNSSS